MMRLFAVAAALMLLAAACADSASAPEPATTPPPGTIAVEYDGGVLHVEVVRTAAERAAGLSNRTSVPSDGGMLFVYETPRKPSFWMRQTLIPLDMLWIDSTMRVTQIHADVQPEPGVADADLQRYVPDADISYVLELNAGEAEARGIGVGDRLQFDVTES